MRKANLILMRKQHPYIVIGVFLFAFPFLAVSCAYFRGGSAPESSASPELSADAKLGALKKDRVEAEEQLKELEGRTTEEEALRDARKREREEEERRLQRSITDDRIQQDIVRE